MRSALIACLAVVASPAAAQDLPPVAGQTLEVTLSGEGEATQEPQGFQITAMFYSYGADSAARRQVAEAAIDEVREWDLPYQTSCLSASRRGFIGNESEANLVFDDGAADETTVYAAPTTPSAPLYYSGQFADEESLARATARLQAGGVPLISSMIVAFDCSAADHAARTAALADANAQAEMLAAELGMLVAGMTSADFSGGDSNEWLLTAVTAMTGREESLVAHVRAEVTFTFERRLAN